jgi:hypothetical protein
MRPTLAFLFGVVFAVACAIVTAQVHYPIGATVAVGTKYATLAVMLVSGLVSGYCAVTAIAPAKDGR